jgi:pimeloyl-ACP methyl ester carboxylesterase
LPYFACPDTSDEPPARIARAPLRMIPALGAAVSGERRELDGAYGRISYYCAAPAQVSPGARPLLLIHSINAAASAYEVKPLYEHYRASRPVYAVDLPGYGFSDRSNRTYTPRLMSAAIHAMVAEIQRIHGDLAIDALALSLSSEYLARAASEVPANFNSVALISPTAFNRDKPFMGPPGSTRGIAWLYAMLTFPLWREGLYTLLTRRPVIRFFLQKTWGRKQIDEGMVDYDCITTRQPGAANAPFYFLSAYLFSADITRIYESLELPVWMAHGVRGDFVDYRYKNRLVRKPNWRFRVFSTGALPHFEVLDEFVRDYEAFMAEAA